MFNVTLEQDGSTVTIRPQGTLIVKNINEILRETFNDTGFSEILAIE